MKLVYFSPSPWSSFTQRPHKFVEWYLHRFGGPVLWIDPYPTRLPALRDMHRLKMPRKSDLGGSCLPGVRVCTPRALPIEPLYGSTFVNGLLWNKTVDEISAFTDTKTVLGIGKPSQLALCVMEKLKFSMIFHDSMDDFPAFCAGVCRRHMEHVEFEVMQRSFKGIASSTKLKSRWKNGEALLVRNAFDARFIPDLTLKKNRSGAPCLGYIGTIDHWFDWDLVLRMARTCPQVSIRLIGPVLVPPPEPLPKNVTIGQPRPLAKAMEAMLDFSVGIIPFKLNRLTDSVDPIKYYEYRALGLPVLSTPFGEMAYHAKDGGVFFTGEELQESVELALAHKDSTNNVNLFRLENSWDCRFKMLSSFF